MVYDFFIGPRRRFNVRGGSLFIRPITGNTDWRNRGSRYPGLKLSCDELGDGLDPNTMDVDAWGNGYMIGGCRKRSGPAIRSLESVENVDLRICIPSRYMYEMTHQFDPDYTPYVP